MHSGKQEVLPKETAAEASGWKPEHKLVWDGDNLTYDGIRGIRSSYGPLHFLDGIETAHVLIRSSSDTKLAERKSWRTRLVEALRGQRNR